MRTGREHLTAHGYRLAYDLRHRALCWRAAVEPRPGLFDDKKIGGVRGRPQLRVQAYPGRLRVELEHEISSGQMWITETDRVVHDTTFERFDPGSLEALMEPEALRRLEAVYRDPRALGPGGDRAAQLRAALALFEPRRGLEPDRVPPGQATCYELGASASLDGKVPYLTLRLGAKQIEIALDHSFEWPARERRIEVLAAWPVRSWRDAEGQVHAAITERMGRDLADAAALFYRQVDEMFGS